MNAQLFRNEFNSTIDGVVFDISKSTLGYRQPCRIKLVHQWKCIRIWSSHIFVVTHVHAWCSFMPGRTHSITYMFRTVMWYLYFTEPFPFIKCYVNVITYDVQFYRIRFQHVMSINVELCEWVFQLHIYDNIDFHIIYIKLTLYFLQVIIRSPYIERNNLITNVRRKASLVKCLSDKCVM